MGDILSGTHVPVPNGDMDRVVIENWVLFKDAVVVPAAIESNEAHNYTNNFYGLLRKLSVHPDLWFITMVLNGIKDPSSYDGDYHVLVPEDENLLGLLRRMRSVTTKDLVHSTL